MPQVNSIAAPYLTPTNDNLGLITITAAAYTLSNINLGNTLIFNSASAQTLTVPTGLSRGFTCRVIKIGTGALTVAAGSGVTITSANVSLVFTAQYGSFSIENYASQTFLVGGTGLPGLGSAVASAAAIVPTGKLFHVTGTTAITSITATNVPVGTQITLIFDGILTFTAGNNLKIAGDFVTTASDTISLIYDGTNFYEIARSVNA